MEGVISLGSGPLGTDSVWISVTKQYLAIPRSEYQMVIMNVKRSCVSVSPLGQTNPEDTRLAVVISPLNP